MTDSTAAGCPQQTSGDASAGASDGLYEAVFDNAVVGMCLISLDGSVLRVNQALCDMLGYSKSELVTIGLATASHPEDVAAYNEHLQSLAQGDTATACFEGRYTHRAGNTVWAGVTTSLLRDVRGDAVAIVVQIRDITAAQQAEREALTTVRVLDSILAASPVGISLIRNRVPVWTNDAMASMAGQSVEEHLRTAPRSLYDDDDEYQRVGQLLYDGPPHPDTRLTDTFWVRDDGSSILVRLQARPLDQDDPTGGYIVTASDITDRKRAESALQESAERFRTAFDEAPIGLSLTAVDGTLLKVNRALGTMLGRTEQELIGGNMAFVTHPDDVEMTRRTMKDVVESGDDSCRFHKRFVHRDGHAVMAELNSFLLRDAKGLPQHFITHIQDVTDRMRAEVALQESERRFREMADLLPDMVFELDRDFRFTYANRAASETMGYPQVGTDTRLVGVLAEALLMRTTENPTPPLDSRQALMGVYDVRREDGTHLPIEVHGTRILGPEGEVAGYRGVGRNITDRKQAEAERLAAISQFAAGVAHDFGSLLATMRSWARLAEEHQPAHDEDLVEVVMRATAQGLALTDQLRAIVRVGDVLIKPVLIEDAIESVLTVTKQQLAASAVEVVRQYQPDGRAAAVDQAQMRRVFLNLIINAQQAMPEGGTLTVATRYPSPALGEMGVVVTFTDTGVGIAPEYLPHIFEPFFSTKGSYGDGRWSGIGLGLSVSHGIVTAHEGTMCVGSEVGVGTTFEVHLPLARSTSSSATWAEKLPALLTPPDEHQEA